MYHLETVFKSYEGFLLRNVFVYNGYFAIYLFRMYIFYLGYTDFLVAATRLLQRTRVLFGPQYIDLSLFSLTVTTTVV
jgi:hypothetical protein